MKWLGRISKEMFYNQNKMFISPELITYTIPMKGNFLGIDVGRNIYEDDNGNIRLETYRNKRLRETNSYLIEKEENKPIINE